MLLGAGPSLSYRIPAWRRSRLIRRWRPEQHIGVRTITGVSDHLPAATSAADSADLRAPVAFRSLCSGHTIGRGPMGNQPRKLAVVTGASGGLGLELARLCAQNHYDLVIASEELS